MQMHAQTAEHLAAVCEAVEEAAPGLMSPMKIDVVGQYDEADGGPVFDVALTWDGTRWTIAIEESEG